MSSIKVTPGYNSEGIAFLIKGGALEDVRTDPRREFLVHLNIQIECEKEDIDVETVQREIQGALEVGLGDMSHTPHLQGAEVEIALAEEI